MPQQSREETYQRSFASALRLSDYMQVLQDTGDGYNRPKQFMKMWEREWNTLSKSPKTSPAEATLGSPRENTNIMDKHLGGSSEATLTEDMLSNPSKASLPDD